MSLKRRLVTAGRLAAQRFPALERVKRWPGVSRIWGLLRGAPGWLVDYPGFLRARLAVRSADRNRTQEPGLLSFVTTVWNTDVLYLRQLVESVAAQDGGTHFEWIILDNGSHAAETVAYLEGLKNLGFVKLFRVEDNLGIIGGMRYVLERASGRYILPLDSDDVLESDCVLSLTAHIKANHYPKLVYTDEDKLRNGERNEAYLKPDWDPVLFVNSCFIAHLCAIDRKEALRLGAYTESKVEGSHDWHTFTLFAHAGHQPSHLADALYSWRMHMGSTSQNIGSKPYVYDSQRHVVEYWARNSQASDAFDVVLNPLFGGAPDWWIRRKRTGARPLYVALFTQAGEEGQDMAVATGGVPQVGAARIGIDDEDGGLGALENLAGVAAADGGVVHLRWNRLVLAGDDWAWDAFGLMELFPDTVMVGGRVFGTDGRLLAGGAYFGFGRGCDCPDVGRYRGDPGYFAQMWKQRSVSAVSSQNAIVDGAFLAFALEKLKASRPTAAYLGAWLGALARQAGLRVAYTPFLEASAPADWDARVSDAERARFVGRFSGLLPEVGLYSPRLGLDYYAAYRPVEDWVRERHLIGLRRAAKRVSE